LWHPLPGASRLATALAVVGAWWRRCQGRSDGAETLCVPARERPWNHLPKRSAGADFTRADYAAARARAREVARATLGEALWAQLQRQGYLDVPSTLQPGGRSPWPAPYLCINPTYPLPEEEFFAQLYLYVRDREDLVRRVAAPQPWDQVLGRPF
jgi:hypothetical protein